MTAEAIYILPEIKRAKSNNSEENRQHKGKTIII